MVAGALSGEKIALRALESEDIELLYRLENDMGCWGASGTLTPFSHHQLADYLTSQSLGDIYSQRQLRLVISLRSTAQSIGLIDLYDFEPHHRRAAVGVIVDAPFRNLGYASEALGLLIDYCRSTLLLNQIWASIAEGNSESIALFLAHDFRPTAHRKAWIRTSEGYLDETTFQLLL